jgi:hypothetical protein
VPLRPKINKHFKQKSGASEKEIYIFGDRRWPILPCLLLADGLISQIQIFDHTQPIETFAQLVSVLLGISQQLLNTLKELPRGYPITLGIS